jgi:GDPmannose 4,6-dehydratase
MAAARAKLGLGGGVRIHNVAARVDWSSAEDIVSGMLAVATSPVPEDYVLSSGIAQSVEHVLGTAFASVGLSWKDHITVEGNIASGALIGDYSKARTALGWTPRLSIDEVLRDMVQYDLEVISRDQWLAAHSGN